MALNTQTLYIHRDMLQRWIHARERACFSRDNNRRVLPFAWGIEHLGGPPQSPDPRRWLHEFVNQALDDSDRFFTPASSVEYSYQDGRLTYPSPIQSPYPENNLVWGRFFPTDSHGRAVIVLPHWNAEAQAYVAFCRLLNWLKLSALRLTLPYHEARKPAHLLRSDYLISPNLGLTIQACRQAVLETRLAADWLIQQGYHALAVVGTSIGSCVAFLTFAHDERFKVGVFNHASSYFADVVWTGLTTQFVRRGLEPHITLDELRQVWSVISPQSYVHRLQRTSRKSLVISGKYDLSFLPELTEHFHQELQRWEVPFKKVILPCGHYTSAEFPFKYIDGLVMANFLRTHLR